MPESRLQRTREAYRQSRSIEEWGRLASAIARGDIDLTKRFGVDDIEVREFVREMQQRGA